MRVNSISNYENSKTNFQGLHIAPAAKKVISENLGEFYLGKKNLDSIISKIEGSKIDILRYLGIKSTPKTEILNNLDVNLHNIYISPEGIKTYLYSIPQLSKGYYTINTKKSILENPISLYSDIVTKTHKAEIANKYDILKEVYKVK